MNFFERIARQRADRTLTRVLAMPAGEVYRRRTLRTLIGKVWLYAGTIFVVLGVAALFWSGILSIWLNVPLVSVVLGLIGLFLVIGVSGTLIAIVRSTGSEFWPTPNR